MSSISRVPAHDFRQVNWLEVSESAKALESLDWSRPDWDGLYFGRSDLSKAVARSKEFPKYLATLKATADGLLDTSPDEIRPPLATRPAQEAGIAAEAAPGI